MLHLLLVRHGETPWNVEGRYQGQRADALLTDKGRQQAAALAQLLQSRSINAAYCSDSPRTRQTAAIIGEGRSLSFVETQALREMDFGEWEGLTFDQVQNLDPNRLRAWEVGPLTIAPPGGETLAQLACRVQFFLEELQEKHRDETVLLVSHGGPLKTLLAGALGLAPTAYWQLRVSHGSLSELHLHPEGGVLSQLNFVGYVGR